MSEGSTVHGRNFASLLYTSKVMSVPQITFQGLGLRLVGLEEFTFCFCLLNKKA